MPRQGVPYPERLMCSLKCELKNIWSALNGKLHSVNGVEGDGSGNVNIVSGDAAVTVTPDASLNQIEVSLDRSQLPSAAVTSVNGEVGVVVLDASEIDSGVLAPGNSVQDDIGSMYTQVQGINSGLTTESTARANADATLQTNINNATLRISTAEGQIVTIEGRVTALETADGQNIKINDINQYAVGLTGNQDNILGNKTFKGLTTLSMSRIGNTGGSGYMILYRFKNTSNTQTLLLTGGRSIVMAQVYAGGGYKGVILSKSRDYATPSWMWVVTDANTGEHYLIVRGLYSATMNVHVINSFRYGTVYPFQDDIEIINQSTTDPTTDSRWSSVTEITNYD